MPAPYGITDVGLSTKTLAEQLVEIELANAVAFGEGVVQDAQSPLGQLNALYADATAELWEMAQSLYGSFDIDQASGVRLDAIGKLRRISRIDGQSDADFRTAMRQAGYGDTKTRSLRNRLLSVDGVTRVQVVENSTGETLPNGLGGHSLAIIVDGGTDEDVAQAIWENTVPGIGLHGDNLVTINADGYCQNVKFIRSTPVDIFIELDLSVHLNLCNCAPENVTNIISNLRSELSGTCGLQAGSIVTPATIERVVAQNSGIVVEAVRLSRDPDVDPAFQNMAFTLAEFPTIDPSAIVVKYVVHAGPVTTQGSVI